MRILVVAVYMVLAMKQSLCDQAKDNSLDESIKKIEKAEQKEAKSIGDVIVDAVLPNPTDALNKLRVSVQSQKTTEEENQTVPSEEKTDEKEKKKTDEKTVEKTEETEKDEEKKDEVKNALSEINLIAQELIIEDLFADVDLSEFSYRGVSASMLGEGNSSFYNFQDWEGDDFSESSDMGEEYRYVTFAESMEAARNRNNIVTENVTENVTEEKKTNDKKEEKEEENKNLRERNLREKDESYTEEQVTEQVTFTEDEKVFMKLLDELIEKQGIPASEITGKSITQMLILETDQEKGKARSTRIVVGTYTKKETSAIFGNSLIPHTTTIDMTRSIV